MIRHVLLILIGSIFFIAGVMFIVVFDREVINNEVRHYYEMKLGVQNFRLTAGCLIVCAVLFCAISGLCFGEAFL